MTIYKVSITGNMNRAGSDAKDLERLENKVFETEAEAMAAVDEIAADWHNPGAVWDMASVYVEEV